MLQSGKNIYALKRTTYSIFTSNWITNTKT